MKSSNELSNFKKSKLSMVLLISIFIIGQAWVIGCFILIINPSFLEWTTFSLTPWIRWIGAILTVMGMALEFSTQLYLGKNYSTFLHVGENHSLITTGPYRYVRHPMYTALITVAIGLVLLSASWYIGLPFIGLAVLIAHRVKREEKAMINRFGEEYIQYMERTGRFFPKFSK